MNRDRYLLLFSFIRSIRSQRSKKFILLSAATYHHKGVIVVVPGGGEEGVFQVCVLGIRGGERACVPRGERCQADKRDI